jgi:hypothetical protein
MKPIAPSPGLRLRLACILLLLGAVPLATAHTEPRTRPLARQARTTPVDVRAALERISPASLRGHLSFIASDLLEGRDTPSRGLDVAAEYIAAQFRRAGLEPVGDDGYFQMAKWRVQERTFDGFEMRLGVGSVALNVGTGDVSQTTGIFSVEGPLELSAIPLVKVGAPNPEALDASTKAQVEGKAVIVELPGAQAASPRERASALGGFIGKVSQLAPAVVVFVDRKPRGGNGLGASTLIDPEQGPGSGRRPPVTVPVLTIHGPRLAAWFDGLQAGQTAASLHLKVSARVERPAPVRNVVGLLRGSDPTLKDTYVLVTGHYDHIGVGSGEGDVIYNGANDDGSGTVSVMEIASALATLKERPKRSILFMTFFGEEKGLRGSRYYGRYPLFPITKTVAHVNLEQVGRTDDTEGPQIASANMTGFDFSDIGTIFEAAGKETGIRVFKHPRNSDAFFGRSDNQALADQGVPAHTISVGYVYPDYHGVGDHWDKIDYENMAKVDRMVALGVLKIANSAQEPRWNADNPKAARYLQAWKEKRAEK